MLYFFIVLNHILTQHSIYLLCIFSVSLHQHVNFTKAGISSFLLSSLIQSQCLEKCFVHSKDPMHIQCINALINLIGVFSTALYIDSYSGNQTVGRGEKVPFNHKTKSVSIISYLPHSCTQLLNGDIHCPLCTLLNRFLSFSNAPVIRQP